VPCILLELRDAASGFRTFENPFVELPKIFVFCAPSKDFIREMFIVDGKFFRLEGKLSASFMKDGLESSFLYNISRRRQ